jgi:hypothetical protein
MRYDADAAQTDFISRRMRSIAVQSAVGGMALSVIDMALATGYLSPVSGAISQEVIDILRVLNALRAAFPPAMIHDSEACDAPSPREYASRVRMILRLISEGMHS